MSEEQDLISYVNETTDRAKALNVVEGYRASKSISEKSKATYRKTTARRADIGIGVDKVHPMTGVSARSWYATMAALKFGLAEEFIKNRDKCDRLRKEKNINGAANHAVMARNAIEMLEAIDIDKGNLPAKKTESKTKRKTLPRIRNWQWKAFDAATPTQKPSIALMWAAGCRPAEVETGVSVEITEKNGDRFLTVNVPGAKVTEMTGQEQREIYIDIESPEAKAILSVMGDKKEIFIQRKAAALNSDMARIRYKTGLKGVSPYSFRHQFAANLKSKKSVDVELIARALGHAVTRSQGTYGSYKQGQAGKSGVIGASASRPVKETRSMTYTKASPGSEGPRHD